MTDNRHIEQNPNNAAAELGTKLRQMREEKGYSVGEVAERLKLPARQIEGLESGNYEGLPELVFVRGFLRTYARFLGLDDAETASYLDRIMPQNRSNIYAVERNNGQSLNYQQTEVKKSFPTWILGVLTAVLIGGGVYIWQNKSNSEYAKQTDGNPLPELDNTSTSNLQADNISVLSMSSGVAASSEQHASAAQQNIMASEAAGTVSASGPVTTDTAPVGKSELVVKVRYRSNLVIKDKDGQFVINRIVPAGSEHRFKDGAPYNVWIGYALGATANYGGKEIVVAENMIGKKTSSFTVGP